MSRASFCLHILKKPTINRFFVVLWTATFAITNGASAHQDDSDIRELTESEVIELVLEDEPHTQRWESQLQERQADATIAEAFPNPSVGYHREQLFAGPTRFEETVELEQRLPISGRRRLQTRAAREMTRAQQAQITDERTELRRQIRNLFYRLLYRQRFVEIHRQSVNRLDEAIEVMERRADVGESSAYELERLRREKADFQASLDTAASRMQQDRAELAGWLGIPPEDASSLQLRGRLLPDELPDEQDVADQIGAHPTLVAAGHRIDAYDLEAEAASRWWIPDLVVRGGFKRERHGPNGDLGFEAGLFVALPLFYRGGGHRDRARAQSMQARATRRWHQESMTARTLGLVRQTRRLVEATTDYQRESVDRSQRILRLAEQSYEVGEARLLELLDAHQGLLDARLRRLELATEARNSFVELLSLIEFKEE